jgi:hypothetical protein
MAHFFRLKAMYTLATLLLALGCNPLDRDPTSSNTFVVPLYTVTPSTNNVTVSPGTVSVTANKTKSFTVTAYIGYTREDYVGGDCPAGSWSGDVYTTGVITRECSLSFTARYTSYLVSGTISGLVGTVILQNNGGDNLSLSADGAFTFATAVPNNFTYNVTVGSQPATSYCTITNGSGTILGADVTNVVVSCVEIRRIFITNATTNGDIKKTGVSGIAKADALCMADANYPGFGTYKALIVDGVNRIACTTANCSGGVGEHTNWVMIPNMNYTRPDSQTLIGIANSAGIFSFPLSAKLHGSNAFYWTGLLTNWTNDTNHCTAWAFDTPSQTGQYGTSNTLGSGTIRVGAATCNNLLPLVCVEQ